MADEVSAGAETSTETSIPSSNGEAADAQEQQDDDDDDDEWEYVEFEALTEADMVNSEWLVGTNWNKDLDKIDETWVRLLTDENGKNVAIWGDESKGVWSVDRASQYFSISKNYLWGKTIWAGVIEDYYYQQGAVRGWNYWSPAAVYGQWQARRLGVDSGEAGLAPWFQEKDDDDDDDDDDNSKDKDKTESGEPIGLESKETTGEAGTEAKTETEPEAGAESSTGPASQS